MSSNIIILLLLIVFVVIITLVVAHKTQRLTLNRNHYLSISGKLSASKDKIIRKYSDHVDQFNLLEAEEITHRIMLEKYYPGWPSTVTVTDKAVLSQLLSNPLIFLAYTEFVENFHQVTGFKQ